MAEDRILFSPGMPFILGVESFAEIRPEPVQQCKPGHKQPESLGERLLVLSGTSVLASLTQLEGLEKVFSQAHAQVSEIPWKSGRTVSL